MLIFTLFSSGSDPINCKKLSDNLGRRASQPRSRQRVMSSNVNVNDDLFDGGTCCAGSDRLDSSNLTDPPAMWTLIGNATVLAFAAFVIVSLAVGHLLGGPAPENRIAPAISTASRHPGIAIAIGLFNFPEEKLVMAAVLVPARRPSSLDSLSLVGAAPATRCREPGEGRNRKLLRRKEAVKA